jgi:hypothetical protein
MQSTDSNLRTSSTLNRISILNLNIAVVAQMQLLGCNGKAQERHSSKFDEVASKINAMHLLFPSLCHFSNSNYFFCKEGKFLCHAILHHKSL